jgi:type VI secretion system protein VasD
MPQNLVYFYKSEIAVKNYKLVFLVLSALMLAACFSAPVKVVLTAGEQANLDEHGNPLPVQVRIYQLQDKTAFLQSSFNELWQQDTEVLGDSLLDKKEVTVASNGSLTVSMKRNKDCHYIGVFAIFRRPEGDSWRALAEVPAGSSFLQLMMTLKINKNHLELK